MSKDFYVPARYQMQPPDATATPAGGIIFPSGIPYHTLARRDVGKRYPHLKRRLLDPQLYLAGLNAASARKCCTNLTSYPWFSSPAETFDSSKHTQSQWTTQTKGKVHEIWRGALPPEADRALVLDRCIAIQRDLGCEAIILPAPMTADPAGDYEMELAWLDDGLNLGKTLAPSLPLWATVAVSDACLRGVEPYSNRLLDLIADQITARDFDGAYIVIEQMSETGYYCTHPNTVGALLRLVYAFHGTGLRVTVALAGMAGLLALAAGADGWSAGWYRGERRLRQADLEDDSGMATPTFYSHALASEIHLQSDLDAIVKAGHLPSISDVTGASAGLMTALSTGRPSRAVPEWEYRKSNVAAARAHFHIAAIRETLKLGSLTETQVDDDVRRWLERAEALSTALYRVGSLHARTELKHQPGWRKAFDAFITNRDSLSLPRFCGHHGYEENGGPWNDGSDESTRPSTKRRWSSW